MINRTLVDDWLARYISAWKSYDEQEIGNLFSEDAEYAYNPFDSPVRGRQAIIESWLSPKRRDAPGTYNAEYHALVVEDNAAIAQGWTCYYQLDGKALLREYNNIFYLVFDSEGRCKLFKEWFMRRPEI